MFNQLLLWSLPLSIKSKIRSKFTFKSINQITEKQYLNGFKEKKYKNNQLQGARIRTRVILDSGLIIIRNTGQSDAKNVKIILDGTPIDDYPGIIDKKMYNTIASQSLIVIQACVGAEIFPSDFIEITWDDKEAEEKVYRISLCI
jgi:hypothetical protein